jgi:hypothetical protein
MNGKSLIPIIFLVAPIVVEASNDDSDITVQVKSVDLLDVTDGGRIRLDTTAGNDLMGPKTNGKARLNYTHNSPNQKKITAETTDPAPALTNDIILRCKVKNSLGFKIIYDGAGGGGTGAQEIFNNINAGIKANKRVRYRAQCTASGTPIPARTDLVFTVTFTSLDQ